MTKFLQYEIFLNCWLVLLMTIVMLISTTLVYAQLSDHSLPESFLSGLKNASVLPVKHLDSVRVQKMQKADQQAFIDYPVMKLFNTL